MKKILILITLLSSINVSAKENLDKIASEILKEAKILYRSEMASWYGTDVMMAANISGWQTKIGGYFSYPDGDETKCIFYTNSETPVVYATITFDKTFDAQTTRPDVGERVFTKKEEAYFSISKATKKAIETDTFFVRYKNVNFNVIPVFDGETRQAYVMAGTTESGILPLGGDYLIKFDKDNKILTKEKLHNTYIPTGCGKDVTSSYHTHVSGKSQFITVTDLCILMLYYSICPFESYVVASEEYFSFWNPKGESLVILTAEAVKKMNEAQKTQDKK